jgi:nitrilase
MAVSYPAPRVAAVHAAPVFLNLERSVEKACALIDEAARGGAALVAFPESYLPAFPLWSAVAAPIHAHDLFRRLAANAMRVPGPELDRIAEVARARGVLVSMGLTEGTATSVGTLWNSNLLIGPDGSVLNHHRKLVPTFYEKLTWAPGDGAGLRVVESEAGRLGMLICGENTNPLARYALAAQGEQIHVSSYPPTWPTRDPAEGGNYDLEAAIRLRAGAHAFEAKLFNVVASGYLDASTLEGLAALGADARRVLEESPRGVSMVVGPAGAPVSEVLRDEEGILYADVDLAECVEPKQFHDITGGYNRFDVFRLTVDRTAQRPVAFTADGEPSPTGRDAPLLDARDAGADGARGGATRAAAEAATRTGRDAAP